MSSMTNRRKWRPYATRSLLRCTKQLEERQKAWKEECQEGCQVRHLPEGLEELGQPLKRSTKELAQFDLIVNIPSLFCDYLVVISRTKICLMYRIFRCSISRKKLLCIRI